MGRQGLLVDWLLRPRTWLARHVAAALDAALATSEPFVALQVRRAERTRAAQLANAARRQLWPQRHPLWRYIELSLPCAARAERGVLLARAQADADDAGTLCERRAQLALHYVSACGACCVSSEPCAQAPLLVVACEDELVRAHVPTLFPALQWRLLPRRNETATVVAVGSLGVHR